MRSELNSNLLEIEEATLELFVHEPRCFLRSISAFLFSMGFLVTFTVSLASSIEDATPESLVLSVSDSSISQLLKLDGKSP